MDTTESMRIPLTRARWILTYLNSAKNSITQFDGNSLPMPSPHARCSADAPNSTQSYAWWCLSVHVWSTPKFPSRNVGVRSIGTSCNTHDILGSVCSSVQQINSVFLLLWKSLVQNVIQIHTSSEVYLYGYPYVITLQELRRKTRTVGWLIKLVIFKNNVHLFRSVHRTSEPNLSVRSPAKYTLKVPPNPNNDISLFRVVVEFMLMQYRLTSSPWAHKDVTHLHAAWGGMLPQVQTHWLLIAQLSLWRYVLLFCNPWQYFSFLLNRQLNCSLC